ncbi:MAG: hypothetical protein M1812_003581 [Candelaria pacifica]|nr:MAG: hypothetical protein M1812_003581 [Candelaria pacifica]
MSTLPSQPTIPSNEPGGFITNPTTPFSPPPSSVASSFANTTLPHPRAHPLRLGSSKESGFINYVDKGILNVNRRYTKKFSEEGGETGSADGGVDGGKGGGTSKETKGYESFREVGRDLESLVDVVWVSGTPSLQIPYLLSLALLTTSYLPAFPPAPRTMFRLLRKVDFAFASLLQGRDIDTGDSLSGFEGGSARVSTTEKVRIKGLVERTRVSVVEVMRNGEIEEEEEEDGTAAETGGEETEDMDLDEGFEALGADRWEMEIARVYDRTLVELGETMGGEAVGGGGGGGGGL